MNLLPFAAAFAAILAPPQNLHVLNALPLQQVRIHDGFWSPRLKLFREVTAPYCFGQFDIDRGGAINNFDRVRDGKTGGHAGPQWYDGLIYEMIRGSADLIEQHRDRALETRIDGYIDRIAAAAEKDPDGYINTWTQLMEPGHRWGQNGGNDVQQHDLYNAGALIEAGVHYYEATGNTKLLKTAVRMANLMASTMGPPPQKNIVPGHSLGEEALVGLYLLFKNNPDIAKKLDVSVEKDRYLQLAQFWIEARGNHEGRESFGAYAQDQAPVLEQQTPEGHAVRATLLYTGVAAAGVVANRQDYLDAAQRIWRNMTERRSYLTGGVGAIAGYEGFGPDYLLPNNGYLETCAAVGAGFFDHNMNLAYGDARYVDEMERSLYNGVLAGTSLSGDRFYYENPLESRPGRKRWQWHDCPCCPPMFLKIMGSLPSYIYAQDASGIYLNLFIGSDAVVNLGKNRIRIVQSTSYPAHGAVQIEVDTIRPAEFDLNLRIPAWCKSAAVAVNGKPVELLGMSHGYAKLHRVWHSGDRVTLELSMPVMRIKANPRVAADAGLFALQRGPLIYCLEGIDNSGHVRSLAIPQGAAFTTEYRADMLGGVTLIKGEALSVHVVDADQNLYRSNSGYPGAARVTFTAIPYYANTNRNSGEMQVWIAETPDRAEPVALPTIASLAHVSSSHCFEKDTVAALNDGIEPTASDDLTIPRFTWWDHRGSSEWVQYDFPHEVKVSVVSVYWWDERRIRAQCRVPQYWRLLYKVGDKWEPLHNRSPYGVEMDRYNSVTFDPVKTSALRMEVQLQDGWSGGILEWKVR